MFLFFTAEPSCGCNRRGILNFVTCDLIYALKINTSHVTYSSLNIM